MKTYIGLFWAVWVVWAFILIGMGGSLAPISAWHAIVFMLSGLTLVFLELINK